MFKFIAVLTLCLTIVLTSTVFAVPRRISMNGHTGPTVNVVRPPGSTFGETINIIGQFVIGNQRISRTLSNFCQNGHKVYVDNSVWLNHFTGETTIQSDSTVTGIPCS